MSAGIKANVDGSAAIQVGGTDVITLTSGGAATFVTSPTTVQAGTAAAPSITFSGDTNTGIYSPGADTVGLTAGGTLVGSVGLGTTLALQGATSQSGTGITFPATQSASSNANTLDDYEEGSWTPTAIFSTSNGNLSYTYQVGRYTKVGNLIHLQGFLEFSETTASGNLAVGGLPFAASTATANYSSGSFYVQNMTGISGMVMALIGGDTAANTCTMFYSGTGTRTNISNTNTGSGSQLAFDICYQL